MVKADAYGTGVERAVRTLTPLAPWGFGVATSAEGAEVRSLGWAGPVVVFAPTLPSDVPELLDRRLEPVVSGLEASLACGLAARAARSTLSVHVEIDTGMGRFGLTWSEAKSWAPELAARVAQGGLRLRGTLTHFHSAEADQEATREQWRRFLAALDVMRAAGLDPGLVHAANSAGAMLYEGMPADLVRPGIRLYGGGAWEPRPRPVIAVRARVLDVRDVDAGTTVSYGATWRAEVPARLATLGIGYADGLRRELSNRGRALLGGREAPIRGVVCMDTTVADVTGLDGVRPGDVATLLGRDGLNAIELAELADLCGTIDYEILTGWSRRLPRIDRPAGPAL